MLAVRLLAGFKESFSALQDACAMCVHQSAEYVKYAKIFGDYFWLIFIPTEDLGDLFLLILCLLKILATQCLNGDQFFLRWYANHFQVYPA